MMARIHTYAVRPQTLLHRLSPVVVLMGLTLSSCINDPISDVYKPGIDGIAFVLGTEQPSASRSGMCGNTNTLAAVSALSDRSGGSSLYILDYESDNISMENFTAKEIHPSPVPMDSTVSVISRGVPIDDNFALSTVYDSFGMSAFVFSGEWNETLTPDYMYNVKVVPTSGDIWKPTPDYSWPEGNPNIRFFGYAPYNAAGLSLSPQSKQGSPTFQYTVPANPSEQADLLVAVSEPISCTPPHEPAEIVFNHVLTGIQFYTAPGMPAGCIKRITVKGVYGAGTYSTSTGTWIPSSPGTEYSVSPDKEIPGKVETELTPSDATFMLIPQKLPKDAAIEVVYVNGKNEEHILTAPIPCKSGESEAVWEPGVLHKYCISSEKGIQTLNATEMIFFTYEGGAKEFNVTSNFTGLDGITVGKEYTCVYSLDNENWTAECPEWLNIPAFSGNRGAGGERELTLTANVTRQLPLPGGNSALKNAAQKGTSTAPYDLSTAGNSKLKTTANCYIVDAPGWYCLPLVYGNIIKDGKVNNSALPTLASSASYLKPFIDSNGTAISSSSTGISLGTSPGARLEWQDAENLVSNVSLVSGNAYLKFYIDPSSVRQGNAVVSVYDNTGVRWSWHIWVTHLKMNTVRFTNIQSRNSDIMVRPLGYCEGDRYEPRTCHIRLTSGALNTVVTVVQQAREEGFDCTYYQWGRKDPMVGATSTQFECINKTWWDSNGTQHTAPLTESTTSPTSLATDAALVKKFIRNPSALMVQNANNAYYSAMNLWDNNANSISEINYGQAAKTIYDPCPAGFQVPVSGALYTTDQINIHLTTSMVFGAIPSSAGTSFSKYQIGFFDPVSKITYLYTNRNRNQFFEVNLRLRWRSGKNGNVDTGFRTFIWTTGTYRNNRSAYDYVTEDKGSGLSGKVTLNDYLGFNAYPVFGMKSSD